ncbi:amidohydrolase family protein [Dermatobacter hominis]|uniref:amidohydrolase family protein n=1 Tax=Dermatobacter hominis TaxID=2884263 RepID=UPI001D0FEE6F|nr:amidohydrolase family protein [Dermatobacter hominis]UDY35050.1 amidohydrolase family protein [Dermatobacter hominis]
MVVDAWVNIIPEAFASKWAAKDEQQGAVQLFGPDLAKGPTVESLLEAMDGAGVDTGVLTSGLGDPERAHRRGGFAAEDFLAIADEHPGRFLVSAAVDRATKPLDNCRRVRELAEHPSMAMVRVTPLVEQFELNHRLYYPVYATCEELGLPVSINVGVPGPQVRSRCQDPVLLEDVLIDFPGLTVIGAHMGHPYESLLVQYMLKWPRLHLMTSAYLATYMDPAIVRFMDSSRGRGRLLFASDHPVLPVGRALEAARALPLSDEGMAEYLGGAATRLLARG